MKPRWMRNHWGCPDCGKTFTKDELAVVFRIHIDPPKTLTELNTRPFDCPHCGAHYAHEDFEHEQALKWGYARIDDEEETL